MYGLSFCIQCKFWTLMKDLERRLEAVKMWFIRKIMRISWTERKTNEKVIEMARFKRSLLKIISARQMKFFGHIIRAGGIEKQLLCGKICAMKSRGRHHINYTDILNLSITKKRIPQQRADQESWQERKMEGRGRRCLEQTWHTNMKKYWYSLNTKPGQHVILVELRTSDFFMLNNPS